MVRKTLLLIAAMAFAVLIAGASPDEYNRLARISYVEGHVSFQHSGDVDWSAASVNMALQPGDRIYTGEKGRAEIEIDDGSVFDLAEQTDMELLSLREDFVQVRILVGLCTLNLHSSISYEISTPAAAFNTLRKGVYRFDVLENGNTDAIVRKGLLDAANNSFSRKVDSGELIHVTPGDNSTNLISHYNKRDAWDEWTDRRDADLVAYDSRKYLPDQVYMGASDLDRYGRWVVVDAYGPAWVPYYADAAWTPYWDGRWVYRPFWGWTWVSYEPWGWLPYHYGRWYHHSSFGWCWLPGASFSFHFWSPGLVRFYRGPSWVSWCPLGPGDYYNVNHYHYHSTYNYYLNNLRLSQNRGPGDLFNRNVPGAFRTVQADRFVNNSFGGRGRDTMVNVEQPWRTGNIVTDHLGLQPTARSYLPAPDRPSARPSVSSNLPSVVRTAPSAQPISGRNGLMRIATPGSGSANTSRDNLRTSGSAGRNEAGAPSGTEIGRGATSPERPSSSIWNRSPQSRETAPQTNGRQIPAAGSGQQETGRPTPGSAGGSGSMSASPSRSERVAPGAANPRTDNLPARRMESVPAPAVPRNDRPATPQQQPGADRPKPPDKPRSEESYYSRTYTAPAGRNSWGSDGTAARAPQSGGWAQSYAQLEAPRSYSSGSRGYSSGSYSAPRSFSPGNVRSYSPPAGGGSSPSRGSQSSASSGSSQRRGR
jgi:hypothetical protein